MRTGKDDFQDLVHRLKKSNGFIRLIEKEILIESYKGSISIESDKGS